MQLLVKIIKCEKLFDPKNPAIVLCDEDLEMALNMKACHVTEIRYMKLVQLGKYILHKKTGLYESPIQKWLKIVKVFRILQGYT